MKLWIDDIRTAPHGYFHAYSVEQAKTLIEMSELCSQPFELIDTDHDAGDYYCEGGDYIRLLDWFEETGRDYPIRIHSMNSVGRENMRTIIQRNGWKEV